MTKLSTSFDWPKPIAGWDMLKWKDETQAEILRETEGMTDEEIRGYFRQASEELRKERDALQKIR